MSSGDRARTTLHERLEAALGPDAADTLMGYLPPVGWADVATTRDVETATMLTRTELHTEIGALRQELQTEIGALRQELQTEIGALRQELQTEIGALRQEMEGGFAGMREELGTFEARVERSMRQSVLALVTVMVALVGAVLAIAGVA